MPVKPGTIIAKRYRIVRPIGKGGMGEVFAAENVRTSRMVAIKLLRAESKSKQTAIERFKREAHAAGSIKSDFVTEVLDVDDDPQHGIILVFELLDGESLVDRLKRTGPVPLHELWGIVEGVWIGLSDAHHSGVVHRDLKPSNVFLFTNSTGQSRVKILDFGISKLPKSVGNESLTQVGQSLGTFSFMPPEQIGKAKSVDHRADIYACTTLIFQAMSGKLPYLAKNVVQMVEAKSSREPRSLGEVMPAGVPPALEAFISKGLKRDPNARFATAQEALAAWRQLRPSGAPSMLDLEASGGFSNYQVEDDDDEEDIRTVVVSKPAALIQAAKKMRMKSFAKTVPLEEAGSELRARLDAAVAQADGAKTRPLSTYKPRRRAPDTVTEPAYQAPISAIGGHHRVSDPGPPSLDTSPQGPAHLRPSHIGLPAQEPVRASDDWTIGRTLLAILVAVILMGVGFVTVALLVRYVG